MWIQDPHSFSVFNVLNGLAGYKSGFTRSGLTDDIGMTTPVFPFEPYVLFDPAIKILSQHYALVRNMRRGRSVLGGKPNNIRSFDVGQRKMKNTGHFLGVEQKAVFIGKAAINKILYLLVLSGSGKFGLKTVAVFVMTVFAQGIGHIVQVSLGLALILGIDHYPKINIQPPFGILLFYSF